MLGTYLYQFLGGKIGVMELLIILVIALIFFGPSKLGDLGKGLGDAIKNFKGAMKEGEQGSSGQTSQPPQQPTDKK
jgi:sec-independent protein translocase protein TatA